jgi:creatinine amidohydrolase/Fe(II)-dependent formamide hydrolase-like protein
MYPDWQEASIHRDAARPVARSLGFESLKRAGISRLVLINGHGGNYVPVFA